MFMHERESVYVPTPFLFQALFLSFLSSTRDKREREMELTGRGRASAHGCVCLMRDIVQCERERMKGRERGRKNEGERSPPKKQKRQLACRHGGASGFRILLGS